MQRQKRHPLLLNTEYPPEARVFSAISKLPGDHAPFIRTLIYIGHLAMLEDEQKKQAAAELAKQQTKEQGESNGA